MTRAAVVVVVMVVMVMGVEVSATSGPRSAFVQRLDPVPLNDIDFYMTAGGGGGRESGSLVEDLRRGHEGLVVKLHDVLRALKEDEVKLNNVFYKLGRHDTDLDTINAGLQRITSSANKIEAKLNKHAYNVDFLRRRMERKQRGEDTMEVQLLASRGVIERLEERLGNALSRLGDLENTTRTLEKRSVVAMYPDLPGHYMPARSPPTLTVQHATRQGDCSGGWERVGLGCYWFGEEELTFPEAVASCVRRGGHLLSLSPPGTQHDQLMARIAQGSLKTFWSCATDAFNIDDWTFLMTAQPVVDGHWADSETAVSSTYRCAALTPSGLIKQICSNRNPYICHRF